MSKLLFLIFVSLTTHASFAQDADYEPAVCNEGESCIETTTAGGNQSVFKLIQIEDEEGQIIGKRLNMNSAITDIFYEGVTACYKGVIADACDMGELMTGSTNLDYGQGGHARIEKFNCFAFDGAVNFEYDVISDYTQGPEFTKVVLAKCL